MATTNLITPANEQRRAVPGFIKDDRERYTIKKPLTADQIIKAARVITAQRIARKTGALTRPQLVEEFLVLHFAGVEREVFTCPFLDNQHRLIAAENLFTGTIDGASVCPREVVKRALSLNAAAVIFAHNHPSGYPHPSEADKHITTKLKSALDLVDIRCPDHFIAAGDKTYSFAEHGLI